MAAKPPLVTRDITKEAPVPAKPGYILIGIVDKALVPLNPGSILAGLDYNQLSNLPNLGDLAGLDFPNDPGVILWGDGQFRAPPAGGTIVINPPDGGDPVPVVVNTSFASLTGAASSNASLMALLANYAPKKDAVLTGDARAPTRSADVTGTEIVNAAMLLQMLVKILDDTAASQVKGYSSFKIQDLLSKTAVALRQEVQGSTEPLEFNTFAKVQAALKNKDVSQLPILVEALSKRVRFDADQTLTLEEQARVLKAIGLSDLSEKLNRLMPPGGVNGQYPTPLPNGGYEWRTPANTSTTIDPLEAEYSSAVLVLNAAAAQLQQFTNDAETVVYTGPTTEDQDNALAVTALMAAETTLINYANNAEVIQ